MVRPKVVLPLPDFVDMSPQTSPRWKIERHAVDRLHGPGFVPEDPLGERSTSEKYVLRSRTRSNGSTSAVGAPERSGSGLVCKSKLLSLKGFAAVGRYLAARAV